MARSREEIIEGTIERIVFRNPENGFAVVRVAVAGRDDLATAIGEFGSSAAGESFRLIGSWTEHPQYGSRFRVQSAIPQIPDTEDGLRKFLGSGLIPGIGPAMAQRLVDRFGKETLNVIATQSAKLREVPGIGAQRAESIADAVRKRRKEVEALSFLQGLGIGPLTSKRLWKIFGDQVAQKIADDPYMVAEQVRGMGFRTADKIAEAAGIGEDDPRRIAGAILHATRASVDEGNAFITRDLCAQALEQLGVPNQTLDERIADLAARDLLYVEGDALYPPPLYYAEVKIAQVIRRLSQLSAAQSKVDIANVAEKGVDLSPDQTRAVQTSQRSHVMVLTGGPGTGKTTTVRTIVHAHQAAGRTVVLAAPTGRAAKRLSEATGETASTIHRLLEWNPKGGRFNRNRQTPLEADVVLVDEASMLDLRLAASLFDALPENAWLILVGDVDQLPPVAAGQVLRDIIDSGVTDVVRLTQIFRQAEKSAIVVGAHAIRHGEKPEPTPDKTRGAGDLFMLSATEPEQFQQLLLQVVDRLKSSYGLNPINDVQVLTPMRRGALGTDVLNTLLQKHLNQLAKNSTTEQPLYVGDKVMQLRNDYDNDVFNGDIGGVAQIESGTFWVEFDDKRVEYRFENSDDLSLAYASTIHKVQGSEFPAVVILMQNSHFVLLNRALLYTALTRAKQVAVIIASPFALRRAIENTETYESRSRLKDRLLEAPVTK